ncbi:MAG: four-carbon acid sugar kinase family protein [Magnetovibrio sp.]|nr:four-carbon acid sugar kinase family protein [Magnetovibrio sp.]
MSLLLGAIADDFTGATDLANTLVGQGMPAVQAIGVPGPDFDPGGAAAVVVALKTRTAPAADAVAQSLEALAWLRARGAAQIFFKVCSTFDSTDAGNIGPVADALMDALGTDFAIACPAYPTNGRTLYQGHLFVGGRLLSESGMKDHPLTPMTDADLVRVLGRQTPHGVGLVDLATVAAGPDAVRDAFAGRRREGVRHAIVDAVGDADLMTIGAAARDLALITGGSGVALGLPENFRRAGLLTEQAAAELPRVPGPAAVLAGSCSEATRAQVESARDHWPAYNLDPLAFDAGAAGAAERALEWIDAQPAGTPVLVYSSTDPDGVARAQAQLGRDAGAAVEDAMGTVAKGLVERGRRRLVVAGGETSGAVVQALGVTGLRIGPEIDPGVPWTETTQDPALALALKSGNFGTPDFFAKALGMLDAEAAGGAP